MRQILAASLLSSAITAAFFSLMAAGPLNPPAGPITPTGVSLDQLAGLVNSVSPGGATLPGRTLAGGGTATFTFSDRTVELPLTGYGLMTVGTSSTRILSLAMEAGLYGGHLESATLITVTVHGSDGTTLGPVLCSRNQRNLANGPVAAGNKALDVLYLNVNSTTIPMTDGGGSGAF